MYSHDASLEVINGDTIRIDGKLVVVEKEEVSQLEDIPQEEFKEKKDFGKFISFNTGWGFSPYNLKVIHSDYQTISNFVGRKDRVNGNNYDMRLGFGIETENKWSFETGVGYSFFSFKTRSFNETLLLDSIINDFSDHTFEGFSSDDDDFILYQDYNEYFDAGAEFRSDTLALTLNKNKFQLISIPLIIGKSWEINKEIDFYLKTGVISTFNLKSTFSPLFLINETNEYLVKDGVEMKRMFLEGTLELGLIKINEEGNLKYFGGIYSRIPFSEISEPNDYQKVTREFVGIKIGLSLFLF